jgi:hypothetical protein
MRAPFLQFRRARGTSAAPPSEGSGGGALGQGVFFFNPKKTEKKRKVDFTRSEIKKRYYIVEGGVQHSDIRGVFFTSFDTKIYRI